MEVLLGTVFLASLIGSLHCVGMCGPFALLAVSNAETRRSALVPAIAYSFGRLVSYTVVGILFGFLGMALNVGGAVSSWQQAATYVAGILMILVGLVALARYLGWKIKLPKIFHPVEKLLQLGFAKAKAMSPLGRSLTIGALTSLMPCGWLYTFAITAGGTGSPFWGGILMMTFWAGTVPIMMALMLGFGQLGATFQKHVPVTMAALVIAVGVFTLIYRSPTVIDTKQFHVVHGKENLVQQVKNIDHEKLPCCQCGEDE